MVSRLCRTEMERTGQHMFQRTKHVSISKAGVLDVSGQIVEVIRSKLDPHIIYCSYSNTIPLAIVLKLLTTLLPALTCCTSMPALGAMDWALSSHGTISTSLSLYPTAPSTCPTIPWRICCREMCMAANQGLC